MMRKTFYIFIILVHSWIAIYPQQEEEDISKTFDDAEFFFSTGDYQEALFLFLRIVKLQPDNANYNFRTGMTYLNIPGQESKAIPYLEKAVLGISLNYKDKNLDEKMAPHHAWFYLGNAYRINNDLDKALESYAHFKDLKDFEKKYNLKIVDDEIKVCERAKIIKDSPLNLAKTNLGAPVNTATADYSPVITPDENILVYVNSQRFYEAILITKKVNGSWTSPVNITPQIGSDGDMRPSYITPDGNYLLLVKTDESNSDIYYSQFDGNLWSKALPLNKFINSRSNETFASISPDGKSMFFTSNRSGTLGGLDIYVSRKVSVGDWGEAENLGPAINTEEDENTPVMSPDGNTLYFSSKGHFNMGGYDVFYTVPNKYNQYEESINIGFPINTTNDDVGYQPVKEGKIGYMTLFGENNIGSSDIFRIEVLAFTDPTASPAPKFDREFTIILSDPDNNKKIEIHYNNKTDIFNAITSDGKKYDVIFRDK